MKLWLILLLCCIPIQAQTIKEPSPYNWQFIESSATYWIGSGVAYHSSYGKQEMNPFLQDKHGRVNGQLYWSIKGGLYTATVLMQKKWPNRMNWFRRISGYVDFGFAAYNYQVKK